MSRVRYLGISAAVLLLDLWTKWLVIARFDLHDTVQVIPGLFQIVHVRNSGAAFGIGANAHSSISLLLSAGAVAVLVVVVVYSMRSALSATRLQTGLHLIIGGAIGNLIDRFRWGYVVDFLDLFLALGSREFHWPAFNVADAAICAGVALLFTARDP